RASVHERLSENLPRGVALGPRRFQLLFGRHATGALQRFDLTKNRGFATRELGGSILQSVALFFERCRALCEHVDGFGGGDLSPSRRLQIARETERAQPIASLLLKLVSIDGQIPKAPVAVALWLRASESRAELLSVPTFGQPRSGGHLARQAV